MEDSNFVNEGASRPLVAASPPAGSRIVRQTDGAAVTFVFPRKGLTLMSASVLIFALAWMAAVLLVHLLVMREIAAGRAALLRPWVMVGFEAAGLLVGAAALAGAVHSALRKAVLVAAAEGVAYSERGIIRTRERFWESETICEIRVAESKLSMPEAPVLHLELILADGRRQGFFAGREPDELRWLAGELRQAVGLAG